MGREGVAIIRAVITGGCGSIGSRLAAFLVRRGDDVLVLDVHDAPRYPTLEFERVEGCVGGVDENEFVLSTIARACPDAIFHLAASLNAVVKMSAHWLKASMHSIAKAESWGS